MIVFGVIGGVVVGVLLGLALCWLCWLWEGDD